MVIMDGGKGPYSYIPRYSTLTGGQQVLVANMPLTFAISRLWEDGMEDKGGTGRSEDERRGFHVPVDKSEGSLQLRRTGRTCICC